ncbi:MAG: HNH endonuclease [Phycisphaerales bacterium]|nr:MAG: HNH endonuclease [Phycisphaerales bacterium]
MKKHKYVELPVTDGGTTKVDPDVEPFLAGKVLFADRSTGYVKLTDARRSTSLHRWLMSPPKGLDVDHINQDRRDNRRANLRVVSRSQNALNRRKKLSGVSSRFRGVSWDRSNRKWHAQVGPYGHSWIHLRLDSEIVAALAVDDVLRRNVQYPGFLNFPKRIKRENLSGFLKATKGRIFSVVFARRSDGAERHMVSRTGVMKDLKGDGMLFDPEQRDLLGVYDVRKKEYRFIALENVLCVSYNKTRYAICA